MVEATNPTVLASLAYVVRRARRCGPSFGRQWGGPILLGAALGVLGVYFLMGGLTAQFGDVFGGALGAVAGIGLGVAVAVVASRCCRPAGRAHLAEPPYHPSDLK